MILSTLVSLLIRRGMYRTRKECIEQEKNYIEQDKELK